MVTSHETTFLPDSFESDDDDAPYMLGIKRKLGANGRPSVEYFIAGQDRQAYSSVKHIGRTFHRGVVHQWGDGEEIYYPTQNDLAPIAKQLNSEPDNLGDIFFVQKGDALSLGYFDPTLNHSKGGVAYLSFKEDGRPDFDASNTSAAMKKRFADMRQADLKRVVKQHQSDTNKQKIAELFTGGNIPASWWLYHKLEDGTKALSLLATLASEKTGQSVEYVYAPAVGNRKEPTLVVNENGATALVSVERSTSGEGAFITRDSDHLSMKLMNISYVKNQHSGQLVDLDANAIARLEAMYKAMIRMDVARFKDGNLQALDSDYNSKRTYRYTLTGGAGTKIEEQMGKIFQRAAASEEFKDLKIEFKTQSQPGYKPCGSSAQTEKATLSSSSATVTRPNQSS